MHTIVLASLLEQYAYLLELLSVAICMGYMPVYAICILCILTRTFQNNFRYCTPCPMAAHLMTIPTRSSCVRRSAAGGRAARPRLAPSGYLNLFLSLLRARSSYSIIYFFILKSTTSSSYAKYAQLPFSYAQYCRSMCGWILRAILWILLQYVLQLVVVDLLSSSIYYAYLTIHNTLVLQQWYP